MAPRRSPHGAGALCVVAADTLVAWHWPAAVSCGIREAVGYSARLEPASPEYARLEGPTKAQNQVDGNERACCVA
jgi:hypothetical protein